MTFLPRLDILPAAQRRLWDEFVSVPLAHVLTYGTHEDVKALRRYLSDDELREAIDHAPPGVFDPRSWTYWNLMLGRYPAPPLPERIFGRGNKEKRA